MGAASLARGAPGRGGREQGAPDAVRRAEAEAAAAAHGGGPGTAARQGQVVDPSPAEASRG